MHKPLLIQLSSSRTELKTIYTETATTFAGSIVLTEAPISF